VSKPADRVRETRTLLPQSHVARRYNVHTRTVLRWSKDPELGFPPVTVIRKRRYYDLAALDAWDEANQRSEAAA
jgi:hypothetical protein